jgi:hypothetical protein
MAACVFEPGECSLTACVAQCLVFWCVNMANPWDRYVIYEKLETHTEFLWENYLESGYWRNWGCGRITTQMVGRHIVKLSQDLVRWQLGVQPLDSAILEFSYFQFLNVFVIKLNHLYVYYIHLREPENLSRFNDWLRAGRPRGRSSSPSKVKKFLFSTSSRPALRSTQPPIQWVPGALPQGGKAAGAWSSPLTSN